MHCILYIIFLSFILCSGNSELLSFLPLLQPLLQVRNFYSLLAPWYISIIHPSLTLTWLTVSEDQHVTSSKKCILNPSLDWSILLLIWLVLQHMTFPIMPIVLLSIFLMLDLLDCKVHGGRCQFFFGVYMLSPKNLTHNSQ